MNKAKLKLYDNHKNTTAATIARKYLAREWVEEREDIFIEKKIQRGFLRELSLLQEYIIFNRIMQTYREIMLLIASIPEDVIAYERVHEVFEDTLKTIKLHYRVILV